MDGNSFADYGHGFGHPSPRHHQGFPNQQTRSQLQQHGRGGYNGVPGNSNYYGNGSHQHEHYSGYQPGFPTGHKSFSNYQGFPPRSQKQWHQYDNSSHVRNNKVITCGPCNRTFYSQDKMDEHLKDHVECPFPECKLSAHVKMIEQHINNQHMLVNFASLQIDDETWIAERKKRFPTAQRAEVRRMEQMEKIKRGEKLGVNKKPFDKKGNNRNLKRTNKDHKNFNSKSKDKTSDSDKVNQEVKSESDKVNHEVKPESESPSGSRFKKRPRWKGPQVPSIPVIDIDLYESDDDTILGIPRFKGTKHFYENTGEMNYFAPSHVDEMASVEDIAISDEEENWEAEASTSNPNTGGALVLGGALGSLIGAYSDSEEESPDITANVLNDTKRESTISSALQTATDKTVMQREIDGQSKNGEASAFKKRRFRNHKKGKTVNTNIARLPRKRKPLLERLLQADIIHERNIILQCVRYIVENNFFCDAKEPSPSQSEIA